MKSNLFARIQKRIRYTRDARRSDLTFSRALARYRVVCELGGRLGFKRLSARAGKKKDDYITSWLSEQLEPVLAQYKDCAEEGAYAEEAPVWVCWWSGLDSAPALVQQCVRSIYKNAGKHPVHLITEKNCGDYLQIPEHIRKKISDGSMVIANFTDYLRFSLLALYGGLWLDATIYCARPLGEAYFNMPVFTCKSPRRECGYLSQMQWTSFVIGGYRGNVFYRCLQELFDTYWKKADNAIDYLLVDYMIDLVRRQIPAAGRMLDAVPENNLRRDDLQAAMNAALPAEAFDRIVQPDTGLYKLSWRETYAETTSDGGESVYRYFLRMDIGDRIV